MNHIRVSDPILNAKEIAAETLSCQKTTQNKKKN